MKASNESRRKLFDRLASSFSLTEKLTPNIGQASRLSGIQSHDEHRQTDILTSGLEPRSRLPGPTRDQWLWEFVARYSGATVPGLHGVS